MIKPSTKVRQSGKQKSARSGPFRTRILVRFRDCDPAGIVFYPRYMEMFNNLVEDWFREEIGLPFPELIAVRGWGVPTVHVNVDFLSPSRLGETLYAALAVRRLGRSSIHIDIILTGPEKSERVRAKVVLVLSDLATNRAQTIPEDIRARLARFSVPAEEERRHADSSAAPLGAA